MEAEVVSVHIVMLSLSRWMGLSWFEGEKLCDPLGDHRAYPGMFSMWGLLLCHGSIALRGSCLRKTRERCERRRVGGVFFCLADAIEDNRLIAVDVALHLAVGGSLQVRLDVREKVPVAMSSECLWFHRVECSDLIV